MYGTIARLCFLAGVALQFLWPRYFFLNVAGKGINPFTLAAIGLLAFAVYLLVRNQRVARALATTLRRSGAVLIALLVYWLWRLVADLVGISPPQSLYLLSIDLLYLGSWAVIGAIFFLDEESRRLFPYVVVGCGVLATIVGFVELETGQTLPKLLGVDGLQAGDRYALEQIARELKRGSAARIRSLYAHPIVYGQVMASMTPIALLLAFRSNWRDRALAAVLMASILLSIQLCNARSPLFVALVGGVLFFVLYSFDLRRPNRLLALGASVLMLGLAAPMVSGQLMAIVQGRTSEEALSSNARKAQQQQGMAALVSRPINGYGDGNAVNFAGILGSKNIRTVDNFYLSVAVDNGYLGCAILIAFIVIAAGSGGLAALRATETAARAGLAAAASIIAAVALGLTILSIPDSLSVLFLMTGYIVAIGAVVTRKRSSRGDAGGLTGMFSATSVRS